MTGALLGPLTPGEAIDATLLAEGLLDECGRPIRPEWSIANDPHADYRE